MKQVFLSCNKPGLRSQTFYKVGFYDSRCSATSRVHRALTRSRGEGHFCSRSSNVV